VKQLHIPISKKTPQETVQVSYVHEKVLDKDALNEFINRTNRHFDTIINAQTQLLIDESRRQRVREAIQEVQARVNSLKMLLNTHSLDSNITTQLVISALNPLQVSLEIAKFRIQDYGDQNTWEACYIVGASALLAGYSYLKQDVTRWQEELSKAMFSAQKRILNETAVKILEAKQEIPWEKVPQLLSPEGIENLLILYEGLSDANRYSAQNSVEFKIPKIGKSENCPDEVTVDEVTIYLWDVEDGKYYKKGGVVCYFKTDRYSYRIETKADGILRVRAKEGDKVPVGATIAIIELVK
jgi:Biotin-requiring enzyme